MLLKILFLVALSCSMSHLHASDQLKLYREEQTIAQQWTMFQFMSRAQQDQFLEQRRLYHVNQRLLDPSIRLYILYAVSTGALPKDILCNLP